MLIIYNALHKCNHFYTTKVPAKKISQIYSSTTYLLFFIKQYHQHKIMWQKTNNLMFNFNFHLNVSSRSNKLKLREVIFINGFRNALIAYSWYSITTKLTYETCASINGHACFSLCKWQSLPDIETAWLNLKRRRAIELCERVNIHHKL